MSIIHEALKKAAAEGASDTSRPAASSHLFRASVRVPQAYRWMAIGISLLVTALLFFSARHTFPKLGSFDRVIEHSGGPSFDSKIDSEVPRPDQVLNNKKTDHTESATPSESNAEGERLLLAGIKLYRDGKIEEAGKAFKEAVALLPFSPVAHNNLGMAFRHQGKMNEALSHYQEAIHLDPNYAEAENNIGLIYDKIGSIDQAALHYQRAIEMDPTLALFHLNYATLLERKGDFRNAVKEYRLYLDLETDQKSEVIPLVRSHLDTLKGF